MARLVLQTAEGQQIVELRQTNTLGRHPSNTIQLLDKIVSKEHCVIEQRGQIFVLRDLGSLNGTFINRDRVQGEQDLKHNDEIALGQTKARFEMTASSQYPPPPSTVLPSQGQPWSQGQQAWPPSSGAGQGQPPGQPQGQQAGYQRQPPPPSRAVPSHGYAQQGQGQNYPQPPGPPPPRGLSLIHI